MPRSRRPNLTQVKSIAYQPLEKNNISLRDDEFLDEHLKPIKIGDRNTCLQLSNAEFRIDGDLFLNGNLSSHRIETINQYFDFVCKPGTSLPVYWRFSGGAADPATEALELRGDGLSWNFKALNGNQFVFQTNGSGNSRTVDFIDSTGTKFQFIAFENVNNRTQLDMTSQDDSETLNLYIDNSGDVDLVSPGDITLRTTDVFAVIVGGDTIFQITESGADGNTIDIDNACIGFTQLEPTYDAANTIVDFRHSNKQHLTFGAGSITNITMYFPLVSGNFQLLIKQDGTGSRTITNYRVYEFDESLADGEATVKFAGGSNPTLTTDANHVDIISIYWDADNEIAYGVATLDFQF